MDQGNSSRLVLTAGEAAQELGIGRSTMYGLIASGEIPTILVGRRRRVPVGELQDWIKRQTARDGSRSGPVSGRPGPGRSVDR